MSASRPSRAIERCDVRDTLARRRARRAGAAPLKELPPKYFYDERGSELFDRITDAARVLPDALRARDPQPPRARDRRADAGAEELVELGSGTASKTRALLYAMAGRRDARRYVPFDVRRVGGRALRRRARPSSTPASSVHGVVGDFEPRPRAPARRASGGCSRSSAGRSATSTRPSARASSRALRELMGPATGCCSAPTWSRTARVLEAAYNDSAGVTAEFNLNVLRVLNRELGADFDPDAFEHVAFFDEANAWIEMRLRANGAQRVSHRRRGPRA